MDDNSRVEVYHYDRSLMLKKLDITVQRLARIFKVSFGVSLWGSKVKMESVLAPQALKFAHRAWLSGWYGF